jgi:hypothetical protein
VTTLLNADAKPADHPYKRYHGCCRIRDHLFTRIPEHRDRFQPGVSVHTCGRIARLSCVRSMAGNWTEEAMTGTWVHLREPTLPTICSSVGHMAKGVIFLLIISVLFSSLGCRAVTDTARLPSDQSTIPPGSGEDSAVVDCILPGQIRKRGRAQNYLTPRRHITTSAHDCEIRGGICRLRPQ